MACPLPRRLPCPVVRDRIDRGEMPLVEAKQPDGAERPSPTLHGHAATRRSSARFVGSSECRLRSWLGFLRDKLVLDGGTFKEPLHIGEFRSVFRGAGHEDLAVPKEEGTGHLEAPAVLQRGGGLLQHAPCER